METHSSSRVDHCEAALHHHAQGLPVLPLDPVHFRPAVDTADWLSQLSVTTITRHWQNCPNDAVGYVVQPHHLVVSALTPQGCDALHSLQDTNPVHPKLIHFGRGGETWHLSKDASQSASPIFAASKHIAVHQPGDVALLCPAAKLETSDGGECLVNAAFLDGLAGVTQKLAASDGPDDPAKEPSAVSLPTPQPSTPAKTGNPMERFSITGKSAALSEVAQAQVLGMRPANSP